MPFAPSPRTATTGSLSTLLALALIVLGALTGSASAQTVALSTGDIRATDTSASSSNYTITAPTYDYRNGNEPPVGDDIDYRNGNEPIAPAHVYVAQMDDYVFDGTWSEPSAPSTGRVNTATIRMNVFNPAGAQAKVRFQAFDDYARRWFERDSMLPAGHRTRLTQRNFALEMHNIADGRWLPTVYVVASNQPVHPEGVFVFTVESWDGSDGTSEATESRRAITFKKVDCDEDGNEWLCNAPIVSTGWGEWAAE